MSDEGIVILLASELDCNKPAMSGLNSCSLLPARHQYCFIIGHSYLAMINLYSYGLGVTIPANLMCMYIYVSIYTNIEMHRFDKNAENFGGCVYKEKRKSDL